jgi:diguanylate cyclase (GGDEF)-like protein
MDAFGLDDGAVALLNALGASLQAHAPEALQAARGEGALASATSPFFLPLLPAGMSEPQRALVGALARGALGRDALRALLAGWAASLSPEEPSERARRDCRPLQELLRGGALRLYADDPARREAALAAAEALSFVQLGLIAEGAAQAAHATSTAVSGQAQFMARFDACIEARRADARELALLYVDCGIVGRVDGVWGYAVGDAVRERLAARLRSEVLREQDLLGMPNRDEFACVLATVQSAGVALLAAEKILRSLDAPLWVDVDEVYARPAVGIALFPEHGASAIELMQHARVAARAARERPDRIAAYAPARERSEAELLLYESRLRAAIAQDTLDVVFQPQRDLRTGLLVGAESLLRWRDGALGTVPVEKAIAAAESAGLMNEVTLWVVNGALRTCREFRDGAGLDLRIGVNLSAKSLRQADLPEFVAGALKTWNLRPSRLALEITETAMLARSPEAVETLRRLRDGGVRLCLDDAAAGYGALAGLALLGFHELKIDLAPMGGTLAAPQHVALVQSLIELAHRLKMEAVAAGVADEAAAAKLKQLGCDYLQGPFVGAPLEAAAFARQYRIDG